MPRDPCAAGGEKAGEVTRLCFRSILASALVHATGGPAILREFEVLQILRGQHGRSWLAIAMGDDLSDCRLPLRLRCHEVGVSACRTEVDGRGAGAKGTGNRNWSARHLVEEVVHRKVLHKATLGVITP